MKKHVLQWHITHKCNLRCTHCYQPENDQSFGYNCGDLSIEQLKKIFFQYMEFIKFYEYKGHINFTGGEPFIRKDIFQLFDLCEENNITFGILTNGTLIDDKISDNLSNYHMLSFVQVSIDGDKKTHNKIRGEGSFQKTLNGCKCLNKRKIQTMVSFTCHKLNYKTLSKVIKISKKNKIDRFWTDRLIPIDMEKELNEKMVLSTEEFHKILKVLSKEKIKAERNKFCKTQIHTNRALQFCYVQDSIYQCSAGISLLTILADGTILPCRRLPIPFGNVLEESMLMLYNNSEIINDLKKQEIPNACKGCMKASLCRGGAKCLSYALHKDYKIKDVNCIF